MLINNLGFFSGSYYSCTRDFFRASIFEDYGYYDEKYTSLEDWPQWLKFLLHGERLFLLDEYTVLYRRHENAVSINPLHSGNNKWLLII